MLLSERILTLHLASKKSYVVRRLRVDLPTEQHHCGKQWIAKLMKPLGIKAAATRKRQVITDSNHRLADNLLRRNFSPSAANRPWATA